jgi:dynein heavy chain
MTLEPPKGLKANLTRTFSSMDNRELNDCAKPNEYKTLLFGFCFFHAIIQDRRKFGPIGWNILYAFTNEDLSVCKKQLKLFLDDYELIPFKVLNYLGAEINYGGRVTDDKDGRLIKCILETYMTADIFDKEKNYKFSSSGEYYAPTPGTQEDYMVYIKGLPHNPQPEAFGLHENAQISTLQMETRNLIETVLDTQARSSSGVGKTRE